jgi:hypothetical protein
MLRDQVFALDHLFLSLFSTLGWLLRLAFTVVLVALDPPGARPARAVRRAAGADRFVASADRARDGGTG